MTYVMTAGVNGRWGQPATIENANDVVLLAAVNAGIATKLDEGDAACLEIVNDGGWTEAPVPQVCWDPRTSGPEQKQSQLEGS